jgi:ABC-type multidrug transport system permease subunit
MTLLFIATGLLLGSLLNDKAVGGISSGIITGSVILSGMFMDPSVMASWFTTLMKCLPFYNSITLAKMAETNNWSGSWNYQPAIILVAYIVVITALAVFVFNKKLSSDKQ